MVKWFVETVENNKESYTKREIQQADKARKTQRLVGWPGTDAFKGYVVNNLIENVGITIDDVVNGENIYGEQRQLLQGKMTREKANRLEHTKVSVPAPILERHKRVQIEMDNIFVNGLPFFHTKSRSINYRTIEKLKSRTKKNVINASIKTKDIYDARGLEIINWYGDNEFNMEDLKNELLPASMTTYAANEHIGSIEREARTYKERARCCTHDLLYKIFPKIMIISLMESVCKWLNAFPGKTGVSKTISPSTIVEGKPKPNMSNKHIVFGYYAISYTGTTNNMRAR